MRLRFSRWKSPFLFDSNSCAGLEPHAGSIRLRGSIGSICANWISLQDGEKLRISSLMDCLFEVVGVADQLVFPERRGQYGYASRKVAVSEAHGHGDCGKAGLWRKHLAVVSGRAGQVTDFARCVAPGRVN